MEIKEKYINELLQNIQHLEARVSSVKSEEALSFSFFRDAFQKTQEMMRLLHELEMQQIEDMKKQMEKLVAFLSENGVKKEQPTLKPVVAAETEEPVESVINNNVSSGSDEKPETTPKLSVETKNPKVESDSRNRHAEGIVLPVYTNPRSEAPAAEKQQPTPTSPPPPIPTPSPINEVINGRSSNLSVNDVLQAPPAKVEVKRSLSLNDRFFYQRELFGNDREAMNAMMDKLGGMSSLPEIEDFLKSNTSWNLDDETVKAFIGVLIKSQE